MESYFTQSLCLLSQRKNKSYRRYTFQVDWLYKYIMVGDLCNVTKKSLSNKYINM